MSNWIRAMHQDECPPGEVREVIVANEIVALCNVQGEFFALDGICLHQGGPLGRGTLHGCVVTCPWHAWQYDVRDGRHSSQAVQLRSWRTTVRDGHVWIAPFENAAAENAAHDGDASA